MADDHGDDINLTNGALNGDPLDNHDGNCDETEYSSINEEIDSLNNCLDELENWNDSLASRMKEFLETMQKSRQELEQTNKSENKLSDKMDVEEK